MAAKTNIQNNCKTYGITSDMLRNSVVSDGNQVRIANSMRKALRGEDITIGVIGGSITQGAGATLVDNNYANQVLKWWETVFPNINIILVNAGIGSTDSVTAVHRIKEDLLDKNPDFVIVEFAVNDDPNDTVKQATYESMIRRILIDNNEIAVLLLFMATESGNTAQLLQSVVGGHYDLPMISYKDAFFTAPFWNSLSEDGVHPLDNGHVCAGTLINNYLVYTYEKLPRIRITTSNVPVTPETTHGADFVAGRIIDPFVASPDFSIQNMGDFQLNNIQYDMFTRQLNGLYVNTSNGTRPLVIQVSNCKNLFLLMKRGTNGGKVTVSVNGGNNITVESYSSFTYAWASQQVYSSNTAGTITVTITPQSQTNTGFSLLGLLVS